MIDLMLIIILIISFKRKILIVKFINMISRKHIFQKAIKVNFRLTKLIQDKIAIKNSYKLLISQINKIRLSKLWIIKNFKKKIHSHFYMMFKIIQININRKAILN